MADTDKLYNSVAAEKARATYVKTQLDLKIDASEKGAASGIATLDENGMVPSSQLPSYIDDVQNLLSITDTAPEHCAKGDLYFNTTTSKIVRATATDTWGTSSATNTDPEKDKIYVNLSNEKTYRWSGSAMIEISSSDVIGIRIGQSGSTILPSQGVIELPAYEAGAQVNPSVMGASGSTHASGLVPDTPTTAGTTKFLREDGTWQTPEGGAMYVPTLNSAPTSSTTTYTKDGQTVDFEIGQFARVADAEAEEGYVFFQLYDLTTEGNVTTAKWKEANTGGGDVTGKVKVSIAAYVNDIAASASLIGNVIVTLTNTTDSGTPVTATWNGSDITFKSLTPLKNYRVAIEDKTGWLRNKEYEDITNLGISEEKSVSFSYSADEYSCSVSGTADGRIVVSGTEYANGQTFRVAKGTSISATAKAVANYVTPTPSISGKTISATYVAYGVLTVVTSSNQDEQGAPDATISAVSPTVKVGDAAAVTYSSPIPIAPDSSVEVEWPAVTGYTAPSKQTFTMPSTDTSKSGEYSTTVLTVSVTSDTGEADLSDVTITVTDTTASSTVTPQQDGTYKIPTGHGYSVSVSDDVEGYKAPDAATGTAAGTTATVTMTYKEQAGFVDLGLPSGKKWAVGNLVKDSQGNYSIGAETDWGTYVSWGNIIGHNEGEGYNFDQTTYDSTPGKQVAANIPSNDAAHDIALATLGSPWHLPTKEDFQELYDNTDSEWVADYNGTGVAGRKFMKKSDHSDEVFFPASGYYNGTSLRRGTRGDYWSSSFNSATNAYSLNFSSSSVNPQNSIGRRYGLTVRPVQ